MPIYPSVCHMPKKRILIIKFIVKETKKTYMSTYTQPIHSSVHPSLIFLLNTQLAHPLRRPMRRIWLMVLCTAPLPSPRADRGNIRLESLLLCTICLGRQFDQCVQRDFHPGALFLGHVHEICIDASQNGLMRNNQDILTPFQFHDNWLESNDHVAVGFAAKVAVIVLVLIALGEVFGVLLLDLAVGEAVADARVELVKGFPFEFFKGKEAGGLYGAFES